MQQQKSQAASPISIDRIAVAHAKSKALVEMLLFYTENGGQETGVVDLDAYATQLLENLEQIKLGLDETLDAMKELDGKN